MKCNLNVYVFREKERVPLLSKHTCTPTGFCTNIVGRDLHAAARVNDPGCGAAFIAVVFALRAAINTDRLSPPELCLQHYAHYLSFTESAWRRLETP